MGIKFTIIVCGVALLLTAGCSRQEVPEKAADDTASQGPAAPSLPALVVPEDAPVLADVYPALSAAALQYARLVELPPGILLRAEGVTVSADDLDAELEQIAPVMREQMRKQAFFMLEHIVTHDLIVALVRHETGQHADNAESLLPPYFDNLTQGVIVSDDEIAAFYSENQDMMGGAALGEITPRIREHLLGQKQQTMAENHIRELGQRIPVALSADWVATQAAAMLDNPLDRGRASGRPTMASFGADSCKPCQLMKPIRESIAQKFGDHLNVVYVHVDRDHILAARYGIRGIPHTIFFDADGHEVHAHSGVMSEAQIEAVLARCGVTL